jgi:hypothetical protein
VSTANPVTLEQANRPAEGFPSDLLGSALLEQLAFARFVDGDFSRHLRPIYRARLAGCGARQLRALRGGSDCRRSTPGGRAAGGVYRR